jgi:hypothetical protein
MTDQQIGRYRHTTVHGLVVPITDGIVASASIDVKPKHIKAGVRGDPKQCAITLGAQDSLGGDYVVTTKTIILVRKGGVMIRFKLHRKAREFIEDYDNPDLSIDDILTKYPKGMEITLLPVPPTRRLGSPMRAEQNAKRRDALKRWGGRSVKSKRVVRTIGGVRGNFTYRSDPADPLNASVVIPNP